MANLHAKLSLNHRCCEVQLFHHHCSLLRNFLGRVQFCLRSYVFRVRVQTLLSLGLSYGGCLSMVHMTMRSVKPSCLSVSAHTRPAGPSHAVTIKEEVDIERETVKDAAANKSQIQLDPRCLRDKNRLT